MQQYSRIFTHLILELIGNYFLNHIWLRIHCTTLNTAGVPPCWNSHWPQVLRLWFQMNIPCFSISSMTDFIVKACGFRTSASLCFSNGAVRQLHSCWASQLWLDSRYWWFRYNTIVMLLRNLMFEKVASLKNRLHCTFLLSTKLNRVSWLRSCHNQCNLQNANDVLEPIFHLLTNLHYGNTHNSRNTCGCFKQGLLWFGLNNFSAGNEIPVLLSAGLVSEAYWQWSHFIRTTLLLTPWVPGPVFARQSWRWWRSY